MPYIEIAKNEAEERNSNQIRDSYRERKQRNERRSDIFTNIFSANNFALDVNAML